MIWREYLAHDEAKVLEAVIQSNLLKKTVILSGPSIWQVSKKQ
jgi:hypothetical protein